MGDIVFTGLIAEGWSSCCGKERQAANGEVYCTGCLKVSRFDARYVPRYNRTPESRYTARSAITKPRLIKQWDDDPHCCYCGVRTTLTRGLYRTSATIDHILPKSKGGSNHPQNLVLACARCNNRRGVRRVIDFLREG